MKLSHLVPVTFDPVKAGLLIAHFLTAKDEQKYRFERTAGEYGSDSEAHFTCLTLDEESDVGLWKMITDELETKLNCKFHKLRIHEMSAEDHIGVHQDNAFPEWDTMIVRLDGYGASRLRVRNREMPEGLGRGVLIPAMWPHEVTTGDEMRYTLVGWCSQAA